MIEQVQDNMKELNRLSSDTLSKSVDLLGRLLAIELKTADSYPSHRVSTYKAATRVVDSADRDDEEEVVSVQFPNSVLKIARDGSNHHQWRLATNDGSCRNPAARHAITPDNILLLRTVFTIQGRFQCQVPRMAWPILSCSPYAEYLSRPST